jgi:alginate O-acetyltransferase complex protein AlgI
MNHFYSSLLTFVLVMLGWIWFRAETLGDALNYFGELLNFEDHTALEVTPRQWLMLCLATVFSFLPPMSHHLMKSFHGDNGRNMVLKSVISLVLFILCLGQIAISDGQPFIYFRF